MKFIHILSRKKYPSNSTLFSITSSFRLISPQNLGNLTKISGFTLIELLITLLLSAILAVGLTQLVTTTRQAYLLSGGMTSVIENTEASVSVLKRTVQFVGNLGSGAGRLGCWKDSTTSPIFKTTLGSNVTWDQCAKMVNGENPTQTKYTFFGMRTQSNTSTTVDCLVDNNDNPFRYGRIYEHDVQCIAGNNGIQLYTVLGRGSYYSIPFYLNGTYNDQNNDILYVKYEGEKNVATSQIYDCLGNPVPYSKLVVNSFQIQKDSNNNSYLACSVWSVDYSSVPLIVETKPLQKIADGVEAFRVLFGIDTNNDGVPNKYVNASHFTSGEGLYTADLNLNPKPPLVPVNIDSHKVVSIVVGMLISSENNATTVTDTKVYNILGNNYGPFNDKRIRKAYTLTLTPNACLPKTRADCLGVPIMVGYDFGGFIKQNQTLWYRNVPAGWPDFTPYCGCTMDANGSLKSIITNKIDPKPSDPPVAEGEWIPYLSVHGISNARLNSSNLNCTCNFY